MRFFYEYSDVEGISYLWLKAYILAVRVKIAISVCLPYQEIFATLKMT